MMSIRNLRGQSALEYGLLMAVVVAVALAVQIYWKNAGQGRAKQIADQLGEQYNPHEHLANFTTTFDSSRKEVVTTKGVETSTVAGTETQNRTGSEDMTTTKLQTQKLFP